MELLLPILFFVLALILVLKGGDFLVDGAIWLARVTRIPDMVIGATVVSLATTLPEVLVSAFAVATGSAGGVDFGINNGTGSMIFNILVILGAAALLSPSQVDRKGFVGKALILIASTVLLIVFSLSGGAIGKIESIILLACCAVFFLYNVRDAKRGRTMGALDAPLDSKPVWLYIAMLVVGAGCIGLGAKLLVDNGMRLATYLGLSEGLVGLTVVAAGTSLPEFVTTMKSIKRGKGGIGVGNILGANILNCTLLMGLCGTMSGTPMPIGGAALAVTLPVLLLSALILFVPTAWKGKTFRWQGAAMLVLFAAYITLMILIESGMLSIPTV